MGIGLSAGMLFVTLAAGAQANAQAPAAASGEAAGAAFERLKGLVGAWRGQRPGGREIAVTYRLTAGGTALVETWALAPGRESLTIYHMDGSELIATHYCPIGNQPRLRLVRASADRLDFAFRDATGLADGEAHQHAFDIEINGADRLRRGETYVEGAEQSSETIEFVRAAP